MKTKIIRLLLVTLSALIAYIMGRYNFPTIVEVLGLISVLVMVNVECYLICNKDFIYKERKMIKEIMDILNFPKK